MQTNEAVAWALKVVTRGWPRHTAPLVERIVTGRFRSWAVAPGIVGHAEIVHARSEEDRERFLALKEEIAALMRPEACAEMVRRALEAFPRVLLHLENLRRSEDERVAELTGRIRDAISDSLRGLLAKRTGIFL